MANTIWKEVFLIMCSCLKENARHSGRFLLSLRITNDYALHTLCGDQHNVCNDEGKYNGMKPCRALLDDEGKVQDIIFGPFFICDCRGEEFASLSAEQLDRYGHLFECPEFYVKDQGEIKAIPYFPSAELNKTR